MRRYSAQRSGTDRANQRCLTSALLIADMIAYALRRGTLPFCPNSLTTAILIAFGGNLLALHCEDH